MRSPPVMLRPVGGLQQTIATAADLRRSTRSGQLQPERRNLLGRRILSGKAQTRGGGYSICRMTAAAACRLQSGINVACENLRVGRGPRCPESVNAARNTLGALREGGSGLRGTFSLVVLLDWSFTGAAGRLPPDGGGGAIFGASNQLT